MHKFKGSLDSADGRHPIKEGNVQVDEAGARKSCKKNEWIRKLGGAPLRPGAFQESYIREKVLNSSSSYSGD